MPDGADGADGVKPAPVEVGGLIVGDAAWLLYDGAWGAEGCSVGMDECQSPAPAVGAVCGDTGVGATCGVIGVAGGTAPAPAGPNPASAWCTHSPGPKLGGGAPWKAAPLKGIPGEPDGGPPPTLEDAGLNAGGGGGTDPAAGGRAPATGGGIGLATG